MKGTHRFLTTDNPLFIYQRNRKYGKNLHIRSYYVSRETTVFDDKYTVAIFKIKWKS